MIPRRIFQTWKSKSEFPETFARWSASFRERNPDYEYVLWDDADNRAFIAEHYGWFLPVYDAYPFEIYRADAIRFFFLHHNGGFYADMDTECLRRLDPVLAHGGVVLGRMGSDSDFEHSIPNAIMASEPGEPFWLVPIAMMMTERKALRPEYVTGSVVLKRAYDLYTGGSDEAAALIRTANNLMGASVPDRVSKITVLGARLLYPLDWSDPIHELFRRQALQSPGLLSRDNVGKLFPKAFTATYWSHSWEPTGA